MHILVLSSQKRRNGKDHAVRPYSGGGAECRRWPGSERIERTWGEKKTQRLSKLSTEEETKMLTTAMHSGAEDICADMVKVIMAWRRGNLVPRWEVPALRALCKDFEPPDEYCG